MLFKIIGLIVLAILNAKLYLVVFFLTVPTISELSWKHRTIGFVVGIIALAMSYYIFVNLPFTVNWK